METTGAGLRRKDTTKGPPLRILSLDGGGVRGYSILILLQELMYKTYNEAEGKAPRRDQIPKPCDYFDLIAGTGTGGIIAIMLGRLRLDLETCKEVYVRMTRRVFETDKTIAGIPYRSTLFKASKLEEAIRDCVREHTIFETEGNDGTEKGLGQEMPMSPMRPESMMSMSDGDKRRSIGSSIASGYNPASPRHVVGSIRWGNPNAYLYDSREERTKTAVTAVYKGTPKTGSAVLLRSYDSRKEPAPEFNCTIWQAGRATAATGLAFKPIQIGQSVFIDEGAGKYNPAPQIMDEAVLNEWPGREVGVFMSIGTGKRPGGGNATSHEWWEGFVGGGLGDFAEARRRLISKIEGCEETHQYMQKEHLSKRNVNPENYYRLNVEVGVGEFGMNEWSRLADISTSTRRYLSKPEVKRINEDAATKMARIERSKRRQMHDIHAREQQNYQQTAPVEIPPPSDPMAVELPADEGAPLHPGVPAPRYAQAPSSQDKFMVLSPDDFPHSPDTRYRRSAENQRPGDDPRVSGSSIVPSPRRSHEGYLQSEGRPSNDGYVRAEPPPLPPKTPINFSDPRNNAQYVPPIPPIPPRSHHRGDSYSGGQSGGHVKLPYPDDDGPPPVVNLARKPEKIVR